MLGTDGDSDQYGVMGNYGTYEHSGKAKDTKWEGKGIRGRIQYGTGMEEADGSQKGREDRRGEAVPSELRVGPSSTSSDHVPVWTMGPNWPERGRTGGANTDYGAERQLTLCPSGSRPWTGLRDPASSGLGAFT